MKQQRLELLELLIQSQQRQRMKLLKGSKPLAVIARKGFYFVYRFLFNLPPHLLLQPLLRGDLSYFAAAFLLRRTQV